MQLGVNFCHDARQPIGFNVDAVRALRPPIVRFALENLEETNNLKLWIRSADLLGLRVLWSLPLELTGYRNTMYAARVIRQEAGAVTAGVEIGVRPWWAGADARTFLHQALNLAELLDRPVLLGLGLDGGTKAEGAWYRDFTREVAHIDSSLFRRYFSSWSAAGTIAGRPIARWRLRAMQADMHARTGLPIAFTRIGWPIGQPLAFWQGIRESWRGALEAAAAGQTREPVGTVTHAIRARWLLEAWTFARETLGASYFVVDAEPRRRGLEVNQWSLYDVETTRADRAWTALLWRHAYPRRPAEA
jgi:hypothetical protein